MALGLSGALCSICKMVNTPLPDGVEIGLAYRLGAQNFGANSCSLFTGRFYSSSQIHGVFVDCRVIGDRVILTSQLSRCRIRERPRS